MHLPTIISSFRQKQIGDEKIDQALELIKLGNFTKEENRQQHRKLINHFIEHTALKKEFQRELKETEKKITADGKN